MPEKLELLEAKVKEVLDVLSTLREDNRNLRSENGVLREQLTALRQDFETLRRDQRDQTESVRTKLKAVLGRVEELEKIGL
jgi:FtsZ-binding cell division protein ZapB